MKYNEILKQIEVTKVKRNKFINDFNINFQFVCDTLNKAVTDKSINSIRVHKYLTNNKKLGKVDTARFLNTIHLDENTKISQLNKEDIIKIAKYSSNK